jgi:nucleotide-binding universal stress UspA family protein
LTLEFGKIKNILVPTDGEEQSMHAAQYALTIAKMLDAQVTVIYVIDTFALDHVARATGRENLEREIKEDGQHYINYIVGMAKKAGVRITSLIAKGRPFEQIVNLANSSNTDLIVMGASRHKGADRILIGSVAQRVIEYASCPVLVVK